MGDSYSSEPPQGMKDHPQLPLNPIWRPIRDAQKVRHAFHIMLSSILGGTSTCSGSYQLQNLVSPYPRFTTKKNTQNLQKETPRAQGPPRKSPPSREHARTSHSFRTPTQGAPRIPKDLQGPPLQNPNHPSLHTSTRKDLRKTSKGPRRKTP